MLYLSMCSLQRLSAIKVELVFPKGVGYRHLLCYFNIDFHHASIQKCYFMILFIYLGFNVAFNTVQVISRRVVGRAEETST